MAFLSSTKDRFSGCAACAVLLLLACTPGVRAASHKSAMQQQGAALFGEKGCSHCHGASGFGGSDSGPDLSQVRKELKPAEIAQQIHDGGNNMPPFGDVLSGDQIAALVEYLHSKRKPPPGYHAPAKAPVAAPPPATKADPD